MLPWLSHRLDMRYVWGPAADLVWGNAVLSRYPISNAVTHSMPNNTELQLKRSFTSVVVEIGDGETLRVIATHLHHIPSQGIKRAPQIQADTHLEDQDYFQQHKPQPHVHLGEDFLQSM